MFGTLDGPVSDCLGSLACEQGFCVQVGYVARAASPTWVQNTRGQEHRFAAAAGVRNVYIFLLSSNLTDSQVNSLYVFSLA